ncbi:regulator of sigma subunit [Candidatus Chlamydia sanziniae]|uniref:Putative sigma regulatory protein-pp2c phosphatase n=1 Tax=Candidatus Chlamydia sanziniae TaxID=1806891 RepID=A0A1A9HWW2_9CHLA|nr:regulator of sigma subunit [Candidatus Chlamydia sanziniae]ANH78593.1 putative sigma regulatory protein-pp2c phosphatase [Candidatus Chlamydia sanziniae]
MKYTFTKRILFFLFLVIPIPLILNFIVLGFFSFSAAKANLVQVLHTQATNLSMEFEKKLSLHKLFLKRLASTLALKTYASSEDFHTQAYTEMMALSDTEFSLCLINPLDHSIKTKHPGSPFIRYLKQHPEIKKKLAAASGHAILLTIPAKEPVHYLVLVEDLEIWNSPGSSGLLIGFYPMSFLQKDLFQSLHITQGNICLVNKYGEVLFCAQKSETPLVFSLDLPNLPQFQPKQQSDAIVIEASSKIMQEKGIVSCTISNRKYLGLILNKIPIQGIYTLSLFPRSVFLRTVLKMPLNVLVFYFLAFILMGWILSKLNKRLNKPLQELTLCMEAAWRGDHNVRFQPQPYGYEINELGNIFNCTLLLLLNSIEKADIDYKSGNKLQKELAILESLQSSLLTPKFPSFPTVSFSLQHLKGRQLSGHFHGWQVKDHKQTLLGMLGLAGDIGLPSYLYALSARSLFLAYANLYSSIERICEETFNNFSKITEGNEATISMTFIKYSVEQRVLSFLSIGEKAPIVFLKRGKQFLHLSMHLHYTMETGDCLICVTGCQDLTEYLLHLPIEALLKDPLSPINSENFIDYLTTMLNNRASSQADGTLAMLLFS